ncbi:unnamed protein product [Blepharisma stoltei]|uniref:Protein kinase domain-containing protein n=1 Tax=Blepharisma stoltei TaxID=1481888 RepID=A0AAU9IUB0_9CILI|nr:unnamed protein product [Blepharisma stoltei]
MIVSQIDTSQKTEEEKEPKLTYSALKITAKGSFAEIFQATVVETGEVVAIKKVLQDNRYKSRELELMKEVKHTNIIRYRDSFFSNGEQEGEVYLNIVMDYIPETIYKVRKHYTAMKQEMPMILVKLYSYQLFRALAYLHELKICHRDVKPHNLLINSYAYRLLLCDFGSAKILKPHENNVSYICSRYYRAPELIFGAVNYSFTVDIWSAGCIVAELVIGKALFSGESAIDQLVEIIKLLGTPTREQLHDMNPDYNQFKFPHVKSTPWRQVFKCENSQEVIDFLSTILVYSPHLRPSALECLAHPFFDELRDEETRLPNGERPTRLFDWTDEERKAATPELLLRLTPDWANITNI